MFAILADCVKVGITSYVMYIVMRELDQKKIAEILKLLTYILLLSMILPGISRLGSGVKEANQTINNLSGAINNLASARNGFNSTVSKVENSPIVNFGAKAKLPATSFIEVFSGGHLEFPILAKSFDISKSFGGEDNHHGIDIPMDSGTTIVASFDGTVLEAKEDPKGIYGYYVLLDHGGGFQTLYAHCSEFKTKVGKHVFAKDPIALSGNTGNSTGAHLHFEVRYSGKAVNPLDYLKGE